MGIWGRLLLAAATVSSLAMAQGAARFDAASVKPAAAGCSPASGNDPVRKRASCQPLALFLVTAYGLDDLDQIDGPDWIASDRFDIDATMPTGTTPEQARQMMQTLMAERFHMAAHLVTRNLPVYELVVPPKGAGKIKPSAVAAGAPPSLSTRFETKDNHPDAHMEAHAESLGTFATFLQSGLFARPAEHRHVLDHTGLTGTYDWTLDYNPFPNASDDDNPAPGIFQAVREQMGLELRSATAPIAILVVDHMDRKPMKE